MPKAPKPEAVVFDVGRVLYQWQLRALFEKLIADPAELDWFLANVITEAWHNEHDAGRPLSHMIPERQALFPGYSDLIATYGTRFLETIPGPVAGTHALVERLSDARVPLFALTNFGIEFWAMFRPTAPIFDRFADIVVSGAEKVAKPDAAIYELAERRFGHAPEALFFTDDNPANVAAAQARGWDAEVFSDAASLEAALTARGLL